MISPEYGFAPDFIRDDETLRGEGGQVDPLLLDLLDLATAAHLQDRVRPRGKPGTPEWKRNIVVSFGARRPEIWRRAEVGNAIVELLHWMTDDEWSFAVTSDVAPEAPGQMALRLAGPQREVVLFSGGLDSTAGAALLLDAGVPLLGVPVWTNNAMRGYQRSVSQRLAAVPGWDFATAPIGLMKPGGGPKNERTRRTRGLVFLVAGWAVAVAAGRDHLLVLENGIGAINLPCTAAQSGCMTSRSVHPRTLALAGRLFSLLGDHLFEVINLHLLETKAQMLARVPEAGRDACSTSESCDFAASGRGRLERRCGSCSSCLLRRMSVSASGRGDWDPREYRDPHAVDQRGDLPETLWQVARLGDALSASNPDEALMREFPQLRQVSEADASALQLAQLYAAYVREWESYAHPLVRRFRAGEGVAA